MVRIKYEPWLRKLETWKERSRSVQNKANKKRAMFFIIFIKFILNLFKNTGQEMTNQLISTFQKATKF